MYSKPVVTDLNRIIRPEGWCVGMVGPARYPSMPPFGTTTLVARPQMPVPQLKEPTGWKPLPA